ncbi:MAG: serine/threonine kinase PknH [Thermoleophilaceae bacterium]|nr:serine/threonine kinase PknH [Thermoleophilaceae bacterium]
MLGVNDKRDTGEMHPGDSCGPYRIEELLGEGGMGFVYRATTPSGETVALKLVKGEIAKDDVFRRRFDREARTAARVGHPNVVPVLDTGEHDGIPYMAQKFITGGSLEHRIKRDGRLGLPFTLDICTQVADGLDAMHAEGLIHRDVKPANILLDEQDKAYITDFGLMKDREASVLTRPGQALGSMDYMAPEQIRGEEVTAQSDVYALGCVMCECLSGKPPFADRQGMRILWAHLQEDPPDPLADRPDVPADVGWAVLRALEKEPEKRPPTATAYAHMVRIAALGAN